MAHGSIVDELSQHAGGDIWVSILVRDHRPVPVQADTELQAGDDVVILADTELSDTITALFRISDADGRR